MYRYSASTWRLFSGNKFLGFGDTNVVHLWCNTGMCFPSTHTQSGNRPMLDVAAPSNNASCILFFLQFYIAFLTISSTHKTNYLLIHVHVHVSGIWCVVCVILTLNVLICMYNLHVNVLISNLIVRILKFHNSDWNDLGESLFCQMKTKTYKAVCL